MALEFIKRSAHFMGLEVLNVRASGHVPNRPHNLPSGE